MSILLNTLECSLVQLPNSNGFFFSFLLEFSLTVQTAVGTSRLMPYLFLSECQEMKIFRKLCLAICRSGWF